eukprot:6136542-Pleurochrysis_carterae.AAC.6
MKKRAKIAAATFKSPSVRSKFVLTAHAQFASSALRPFESSSRAGPRLPRESHTTEAIHPGNQNSSVPGASMISRAKERRRNRQRTCSEPISIFDQNNSVRIDQSA